MLIKTPVTPQPFPSRLKTSSTDTESLPMRPPVRHHDQYNNAFGLINPHGDSPGGAVRFLGTLNDHARCEAACLHSTIRCWSFVHLKPGAPNSTAGKCFAVMSPGWNPTYDETASTGAVQWPCRDDEDCSLNGACVGGSCACRAAWSGHRCETLLTLPARRGAGYHGIDDGRNTSSWGAAVLRGHNDGLYHMWVSELAEHCGIGAWQQNSRIVHATSTTADGTYTRREVTWPVFAHTPSVVPGPSGEIVMYFTADFEAGGRGACQCCRARHGPCDGSTGPGDCPPGESARVGRSGTYMSWTVDPNGGSWSKPEKLFSHRGGDTNFSPLLLANGSLVGMWRRWIKPGSGWTKSKTRGRAGSRIYLATARDWRNASCYIQHRLKSVKKHRASAEVFPELGSSGTEDQFLYLDDHGHFHAFFHHMVGTGTTDRWWLDATGGHAFSRNGLDWTYSGVAWGDALARYDTPSGRGVRVAFDDGSSARFTRFERPHLIFAGRELRGDPTHLIAAAQYGSGESAGTDARSDDGTCTIIIPIAKRGGGGSVGRDNPARQKRMTTHSRKSSVLSSRTT